MDLFRAKAYIQDYQLYGRYKSYIIYDLISDLLGPFCRPSIALLIVHALGPSLVSSFSIPIKGKRFTKKKKLSPVLILKLKKVKL